jgi:hypothetical protein
VGAGRAGVHGVNRGFALLVSLLPDIAAGRPKAGCGKCRNISFLAGIISSWFIDRCQEFRSDFGG